MKTYALSYDPYRSIHVGEQLLAFVKDNRNVVSWSRPYDGLYLLKSENDFATILNSFRSFFGINISFFISEVRHNSSGGILQQDVWNWFNQGYFPNFLAGND